MSDERPGAQWRHGWSTSVRISLVVLVFWIIVGCGCYGAWRIFK
jgi:hypothetical protein